MILKIIANFAGTAQRLQKTPLSSNLASFSPLNRLETLGETFRAALNSLAVAASDWLAKQLKKDWFDRYRRRNE